MAEFSLTVNAEEETLPTLLDGEYSLKVQLPPNLMAKDESSSPLLSIGITSAAVFPIEILLVWKPIDRYTYFMSYTEEKIDNIEERKAAVPSGKPQPIKFGETYVLPLEGEPDVNSDIPGVPDNGFGFQNEFEASPMLFRELNDHDRVLLTARPLWIAGTGILIPSTPKPSRPDEIVSLWFENASQATPGEEVSTTDKSEPQDIPFRGATDVNWNGEGFTIEKKRSTKTGSLARRANVTKTQKDTKEVTNGAAEDD